MPSIESQQAATIQALSEVPFSEWKKNNPIPVMVAGAVASKGGQMAGKAAHKGAEVAAQAAEDIVPAVADWAGGVFDKIKGKFKGNPDIPEVDINSKEAMDKWDWSTKQFQDFDGDWVYYTVAPASGGEPILIKVKYDPMYDWDFEPQPWDEEYEPELTEKLKQSWAKHLGSKETVRKELLDRIKKTEDKIDGTKNPVSYFELLGEALAQGIITQKEYDRMIKEREKIKKNPSETDNQGGNEMTEQKVEEKQNPPANPTLYEGVIDPNFLPKPEVMPNPPTHESLDAEWEKAGTPEEKKSVKKRAFLDGMSKCRKGKKAKDPKMVAEGKSLLAWTRKRKIPKSNPQPPETKPEETKPDEKPDEKPEETPETSTQPVPVINPPEVTPEKPKDEEKPSPAPCQHELKYLGVGNPIKGGKPMKVFKCLKCAKTFAKGVDA